tara:strand:+ start:62 stop:373 length:312 start_codon:yes stop_codon:yes gene_type:complete
MPGKKAKAKKTATPRRQPRPRGPFGEFVDFVEKFFLVVTCPCRNWNCAKFFFWFVLFPIILVISWRLFWYCVEQLLDTFPVKALNFLIGIVWSPLEALKTLKT